MLETSRLILRRWLPGDVVPFAAMNADDDVMEFFPRKFSHEQTVDMVATIESDFDSEGFGLWAVEIKATGEFIGYTGLGRLEFDAHFTPNVGWVGVWLVPFGGKDSHRKPQLKRYATDLSALACPKLLRLRRK